MQPYTSDQTPEVIGTIADELPRAGMPATQRRWAEFFHRTRPQWELLAKKLMAQWRTSYALQLEDVMQEMQWEAVLAHARFDPKRGPSLGSYVVWSACAVAKRAIHRDRQVQSRDRSSGKSKAPLPVGEYDRRAALQKDDPVGLVEATADAGAEHAEQVLELMSLAQEQYERQVMADLLRDFDLEEAGRRADLDRPSRRAYVAAVVCLSRAG